MSGLANLALPDGLELARTTPRFDTGTVPAGLLAGHRVAPGVWGCLRVHAGTVTFVVEATGARRVVGAGEHQVIEPEVVHRVELGAGAEFAVEFWR